MNASLVCLCLLAAAADRPGWLNVNDLGASGSTFETTASTLAGSKLVTVANVGDFRPGQGVIIAKCQPRLINATLWGPKRYAHQPLGDAVQIRSRQDEPAGNTVFMLDVAPGSGPAFRWSDDLRTWKEKVAISYDWQTLSHGVEVRFARRDWTQGCTVTFTACDQLATVIEKIEGAVLTLRDAPQRTAKLAAVRHCDHEALQAAIDRAVAEKRNLFFPTGFYRLARGLVVTGASTITLEGASSVETILDISEGEAPIYPQGEGACFKLLRGAEVTLRNFRMVGPAGFSEADKSNSMRLLGAETVWRFWLRQSSAVTIYGTERVLVENCHASRMTGEAFYSSSGGRSSSQDPRVHTTAITYLRCSVVDSARNAFNNNDAAENTSVLYCRIQDVGGCSWEGASRYVRFIGNYVRNSGTVAMGNVRSRAKYLEEFGRAQHIIADNVFEGQQMYGGRPGGFIICASASATQVIVRNNLFVNFNSSGVDISGAGTAMDLPGGEATITGNVFDLTCVDGKPVPRTGIQVSAADVIVADNQVYLRGAASPEVTGIKLVENAVNLNVHDNLIRNCGTGLITGRAQARVAEVLDERTFLSVGRGVPLERRQSHCYRGWNLAWLGGRQPPALSVIEAFDPETLQFKLREPYAMEAGKSFEVYPPAANWNIHDNTIAGCLRPVVLDSHGSATSLVRNNLISRGEAAGAKQAIEVHGRFDLAGNQILGFDEVDHTPGPGKKP